VLADQILLLRCQDWRLEQGGRFENSQLNPFRSERVKEELAMAGVAARTALVPGRADAAGTALYAQLMTNLAGLKCYLVLLQFILSFHF
jgi:hypothetical protein